MYETQAQFVYGFILFVCVCDIYRGVLCAANALYDLTGKNSLSKAGVYIFALYLLVIPTVTFIIARFSPLKWYVDPFIAIEFVLFLYCSMLINSAKYSDLATAFKQLPGELGDDGGAGYILFAVLFVIELAASLSFKRVKEQNIAYKLLAKYKNRQANNMLSDNKTTDWQFDLASLPDWDRRDKIPFVYDRFYSLPQNDMLLCIYSIDEVRMLYYLGNLAILKNKASPELVLNVSCPKFTDAFAASEDGNIAFLQASISNDATGVINHPIIIFDLAQNKFAIYKPDTVIAPKFSANQIKGSIFEIETYDTQNASITHDIDLKTLTWFNIISAQNFDKIVKQQAL